MPSIISNFAAVNAQNNLSRTQSQTTVLSSQSIKQRSSLDLEALIAAQKERAEAEASSSNTVAKAQLDESTLSESHEVLSKMRDVVLQAFDTSTSAGNREALNDELTNLKGSLASLNGTAAGDALNKSYATESGNSYHVLGSAAGQGSREISISASTTADDYNDMLSAIDSMQKDVATARSATGATMIAAQQQSVDKSGLGTQVIPDNDISEAVARAEAARKEMEATRLNLSNMFSNSNHAAIFALLQ